MNWQHLVYFRAIVENDSFTKTAEKLHITLSALSKAIHSLEKEIAVPLFEKRGRISVLTKYGEQFYPYVCRAIDAIDEGMVSLRYEMQDWRGHINIAGVFTQCTDYLPPLIKEFNEMYANISFSLYFELSGVVLQRLLDYEIDLGFTGDFDHTDPKNKKITARLISREELVVIVPEDHPQAGQESIDFSRLDPHEQFIFYKHANSGLNTFIESLCSRYGLSQEHSFEAFEEPTMISMVASGLGIGLIPNLESLRHAHVAMLRIKEDTPYRSLYIVWRKNGVLSSAASLFRDYILDGVPPELLHME